MHSENFKDQVVLPLQSALFRLASSLLRDRQEAEDTVQEILMRLWLRKDSLKDLRNIKAFALKMARNLSCNVLDCHSS
jgi:DNA-directed RNA polymerase specialized sigma24 family protein